MKLLRTSELARQCGLNLQTLRYYERRGLLPQPPRRGAFRTYADEAVRIVQFIKRAQELGFSLDEVEQLLRLRGVPPHERHRRELCPSLLFAFPRSTSAGARSCRCA